MHLIVSHLDIKSDQDSLSLGLNHRPLRLFPGKSADCIHRVP